MINCCCCLVAKSHPTLLWPARLLCPWDFPGENTGVGWSLPFYQTEQSSELSQRLLGYNPQAGSNKIFHFFLRLTAVKSPTYKLSSFEVLKMQTCFHVSNHVTCLAHSHVRASSASSCAFVYFNAQYCIEHSSTVSLFQARFARGYLHWTSYCAARGAY